MGGNPQCQPSNSKHLLTEQMQFTPAKMKSSPVQWGAPALVGSPWSDPLPQQPSIQGKQEGPYSHQEVHDYWKNTGAFTTKHSLLSISYLSAHIFFPYYRLQNIILFVILGKALKISIFGLRNSKIFFFFFFFKTTFRCYL